MRKMVHQFKYGGGLWLAEDFADFLQGCFRMHYGRAEIDLILPVPLHFRKYFSRGYNQAEVLAAALSERTKIPCRTRLLRRKQGTATQTFLSATARRKNVRNVFHVRDPKHELAGKTILLIDDVVTTGATLNECARLLKEAGARAVHCLTAATGY